MKASDFSRYLTTYLAKYLPEQRNLSANTLRAYRDAFRLLLLYCKSVRRMPPDRITLKQIDAALIADFLEWLRKERNCAPTTVNHRLNIIRSFFEYVQIEAPEYLLESQRIKKIPFRKAPKPPLNFFTENAIRALLAKPDGNTRKGFRDLTLLSLLYDSAARVQEMLDLRLKDIRLDPPESITVCGKGKKVRTIPIMRATASLLRDYIASLRYDWRIHGENTLFFNAQNQQLGRVGVAYILRKYVSIIEKEGLPIPGRISPHVLRHTKAMHLLRAGVPLIYIRDFLGHVDIKTTQIYADIDFETKRKAIEKAAMSIKLPPQMSWENDGNIMDWLTHFCAK